jgi:hypothetical protein
MSKKLLAAACLLLSTQALLTASGHGPVFGLATPTNPKGGFSFDTNFMGRAGDGYGTMLRASLGYGLTENLKVSVSAPALFKTEPFPASRLSAFTPMGGDFEALAIWRFHRQDTGVGSRFESAAIGGVLVPGPQAVNSRPGALIGGVTGVASRSHYAWGGLTYQRYAGENRDRRPDLLFYSMAYAYRPRSWRTDTGWDWRLFGEMTGERSGSNSHQVFLGPTTLGVYKNYAVSAGVQFPVYRDARSFYPRERVRFAVNFAYFF